MMILYMKCRDTYKNAYKKELNEIPFISCRLSASKGRRKISREKFLN